MSPGRKPSFSPASTAGRVRMMRRTCRSFSARTASDGRIGLARAGRPHGEQQVVPVVEFDEPLLVDRPGADDRAVVAVDDHVLVDRGVVLRDAARETLFDDLGRDVAVIFDIVGRKPSMRLEKRCVSASGPTLSDCPRDDLRQRGDLILPVDVLPP